MEENKVCVILGPTATKKTDFSIWLSEKIDGEIISADSMQIYKNMDIATAKVNKNKTKNIKHHMLDFLDVDREFSVAQYVEMARELIYKILEKRKRPIVVGGTGLYINCLLSGIKFEKNTKNNLLREKLEQDLKTKGKDYIFEILKKLDPEYAEKIHKNNVKRVLRAIEIVSITKKSIKQNIEQSREKKEEFKTLKIGFNFKDRNILYENIRKRVDLMVEEGLFEEAKKILNMNPSKTAMQAIGYKEIKQYFEKKISYEEAILKIKQNSTKYAKRQLTWFKKDKKIHWFFWDEEEKSTIEKKILQLTKNFYE